ncbi:MAG: YceI family protein [Flavobacteriaceae bacterium]
MKNIIYILLLVGFVGKAQDKYLTKVGIVNFEASVPSFEEVVALNNAVTAIVNTTTNEFAALVLIKGFRFKNALMEEHFNENYAESNLYPKSTFKGNILGNKLDERISGDYKIEGDLTFHGVTQSIQSIPIQITFEEDAIIIKGNFTVKASEYDIKIPNIVKNKVSDSVILDFIFDLKQ